MKKILTGFLLLFLIGTYIIADETVSSVQAEKVLSPLDQAQIFYNQRDQAGNIEKAIAEYKNILEVTPDSYDGLWKLARCYKWAGDHAAKKEQLKTFETGKRYAERAIKINPKAKEGYLWYGILLGRHAEEKGILDSLGSVGPVKDAMEKILAIDQSDGDAQHVLGVLYRKAPGWPLSCGDIKRAKEHALKAAGSERAAYPYVQIGLAEVYISIGDKVNARKVLQSVALMNLPEDYVPEGKADKELAVKLLKDIE
jgi:tetratricopeptide (TPR) repeat protein